jgi:hypothetical protein
MPANLRRPNWRLTRRQMLRSSLTLGAFVLPRNIGQAAVVTRQPRAQGIIVLMLEGGMSHLESWDPKPDAPAETRGEFGSIATSVAGLRVGEQLQLLAKQAERFNIVRSVHCDARNDHSPGMHLLLTGWENTAAGVAMERSNLRNPSQGSVLAHLHHSQGRMARQPPVNRVGPVGNDLPPARHRPQHGLVRPAATPDRDSTGIESRP